MGEDVRNLEGVESLEIGHDDESWILYVNRHDGAGSMVRLDNKEYEALEKTFMITDKVEDVAE